MKRRSQFLFAAAVTVLCWLFYTVSGNAYFYSDNVGVAIVLNGYFGSPLCQYQHPLFCVIVNLLSRVFSSADMYMVTVHIFIFIELIAIMMILTDQPFQKKLKNWIIHDYVIVILSVLTCFYLSAGLNLWCANYTVQAASFIFSGLVVLFWAKHNRESLRWIALGTIMSSVGYMLRKEAGLLFIPFVALAVIHDVITDKEKKEAFHRIRVFLMPVCVIVCLLFISQTIFDSIEPYATAKRYNDARTALVDYPSIIWRNDESFAGIKEADYNGLRIWMLADTDIYNADYLDAMAKAGTTTLYPLTGYGLQQALREMFVTAAQTDVYMLVMILVTVIITVWNILAAKGTWSKVIAICGILGSFIILLYYTIVGRALLRVWQPVIFAALTLEITITIRGADTCRLWVKNALAFLLCSCLYYSAGQVFAHAELHEPQTVLNSRINAEDSAYATTFDEDSLFIWRKWQNTIPKHFADMGKLPTKRVLEHNIALGDWTYGQPYYLEFLEEIEHSNPLRDLVEKDNVYIMSDLSYIINFLREHYGEDINLVEAGEVNGSTAYRAIRSNE